MANPHITNLKARNILVTGAGGFIGSHLVEKLVHEGAHVRALVHYNSSNSWGWLDTFPKDLMKDIEILAGDVRDPNGIRKAVAGIDFVFHLAALIGIPYSYHSPDSYVDTNIKGTLNILAAARDSDVQKVLVTSTSEVYGTARYVPIDEKHPRQAQSPYSASKIGADALAESYYRSFDLPVTIVRPFNTYGPRQSARAVIPTIMTQLLSGKREIHLGSLDPTRDLNFVTDTCAGFIALAMSPDTNGKEVNIGSGKEISIGELVRLIMTISRKEADIICDDARKRPDMSEVERLVCDNSLIAQLTGWAPRVSLAQGLTETFEWFKDSANLSRYKSGIYNV